jgi:hypothetical protein
MYRHQIKGQIHYIKIVNEFFENVANFIYLGTMVTNQSCIHDEIKSRKMQEMLANTLFRIFCLLV